MTFFSHSIVCALALGAFAPHAALAWGRHDLITQAAIESGVLSRLKTVSVRPESMESAAPDLLKKVIPGLKLWCLRYHHEHDTRYNWVAPQNEITTHSDREKILWALEDNIQTQFEMGSEKNAAQILIRYVNEPDGELDSQLGQSPYIERLRESMSYFYENNANTHGFRHYFIPSSLIPPILIPKGIAPYRAALYAELSAGAFKTGHPYWGYRFLAWSIHYVQDVTQPWHTVFLPGLSFLNFSKAKMKHEVSALHYLTEAFIDSAMLRPTPVRNPASLHTTLEVQPDKDPWSISKRVEKLASDAHIHASEIAAFERKFFSPVVDGLSSELTAQSPTIKWGGIIFPASAINFSGDGAGATTFLSPIWNADFEMAKQRDQLLSELFQQVDAAEDGSRFVILNVLARTRTEHLH